MNRQGWREGCSIVLVALGAAACGSSSTSPENQPTPTPTAQPALVATALGAGGTLTSVNAREWIALVATHRHSYDTGTVVLPPDAGPDAGPLPVPGCPLVDPPPGCARTKEAYPMFVGETDWLYGEVIFHTPSGFSVPIQEAFGPQGEIIDLVQCCGGDLIDGIRPGPGPLFFGSAPFFDPPMSPTPKHRPVYWPTPGFDRLALPSDGFADGPVPLQSDAQQRIAGVGVDPVRPVVWLPDPAGYTLAPLPPLEGGVRGAALGIDDGRIVGWSADAGGAKHAVLWTAGDDQSYVVQSLPVPDQAVSCATALGISATRIVGECTDSLGGNLVVAWTSSDGSSWDRTLVLPPLPGDAVAHVLAISGTLVVGISSQTDGVPSNVFWRLP